MPISEIEKQRISELMIQLEKLRKIESTITKELRGLIYKIEKL